MNAVPVALAALVASAPRMARAAGVYSGDNGSQAAQRAGAFVAKADDPSALAHNPAGLVKAARFQLYLGGNMVRVVQEYQRAGTYPDNSSNAPQQHAWAGQSFPTATSSAFKVLPTLAASQRWRSFAVAEGIFSPHGMATRNFKGLDPNGHEEVDGSTPTDEAPGPQRYDLISQDGILALPSLGTGIRILDQLDVGGRVSWGIMNLKTETAVWAGGNEPEDPGSDAEIQMNAWDKTLFQWAIGILARPASFVELGVAYTSAVHVRATGTSTAVLGPRAAMGFAGTPTQVVPIDGASARCAPGETRTGAGMNACLNLDLPARLAAGGRLILRDGRSRERADLELDVRWEQWSKASEVEVIVDGMDELTRLPLQRVTLHHRLVDTWSFLVGGSWSFQLGANVLIARAGGGYETGAAPLPWTRLDIDGQARIVGALGAGYEVGRYRIDAGVSVLRDLTREVPMATLPEGCTTTSCQPQPSPTNPLETRGGQAFHPFNAGRYETSYVVGSVGVTATF